MCYPLKLILSITVLHFVLEEHKGQTQCKDAYPSSSLSCVWINIASGVKVIYCIKPRLAEVS